MEKWLEGHSCILTSQKCNRNASVNSGSHSWPLFLEEYSCKAYRCQCCFKCFLQYHCTSTGILCRCGLLCTLKCVCKISSLPKFRKEDFFPLQSSLCLSKVSLHSLNATPPMTVRSRQVGPLY